MTNPFVVFINRACTPKTDSPFSPFLGEHGRSPPGEGHGCPFDGLKKAGGSKGTRPLGRPLGLGGKGWPKSLSFAAGAKHPACKVVLGAFFSFNGPGNHFVNKLKTRHAAGFQCSIQKTLKSETKIQGQQVRVAGKKIADPYAQIAHGIDDVFGHFLD